MSAHAGENKPVDPVGDAASLATAPPAAVRARISETYAAERHALEQEKLILDNLPLVKHIVQKVAAHLNWRADMDDLISAGTLALVQAAGNYDPSHHATFVTYAYIRVRGAVIDELRKRSFVPNSVHQRIRHIQQAYDAWQSAHGRPPTDEELARQCEVSLERLYQTLEEARNQQFLSIHGLSEDGPALSSFVPAGQDETPDEQAAHAELLEGLAKAIRELPERERLTILLYYERDLTMKEAAEVLAVTESRVSQLHASALFKLSMKLRNLA